MNYRAVRRVATAGLFILGAYLIGLSYLGSFPRFQGPHVSISPSMHTIQAKIGVRKVRVYYKVSNDGELPVNILDIKTSCGCTLAVPDKRSLHPGETSLLTIEAIPPTSGERLVNIELETNWPEIGALRCQLQMQGSLPVPYVTSSSGTVQFGEISELPAKQQFFIEAEEAKNESPWLADPISSIPELSVSGGVVREIDTGGGTVLRRYEFLGTLQSDPQQPQIAGKIVFAAQKKRPTFEMAVYGSIPPPIAAVPSVLMANLTTAGHQRKMLIPIDNSLCLQESSLLLNGVVGGLVSALPE